MKKYRVRLVSGRVIGPFTVGEFPSLISKTELTGEELFQEFPAGEWKKINKFPELNEVQLVDEKKDETFLLNLKNLNVDSSGLISQDSSEASDQSIGEIVEKPREFKFDLEDPFKGKSFADEDKSDDVVENIEEPEDIDKTRVNVKNHSNIDKTVMNLDYQKFLEEEKLKKEAEEKRKKEEERKKAFEQQVVITEPDYENEKTQMVNVKDIGLNLESAIEIEEELEQEKVNLNKKSEVENSDKKVNLEDELPKEKRKFSKLFIILFSILIVIVFLTPDKNTNQSLQPISVIKPEFKTPMRNSTSDIKKSQEFYNKGLALSKQASYLNHLKAAKAFHLSLVHNFDGNPAGAKLIYMYSYLLSQSSNFNEDVKVVYRLVQLFKRKSYTDPQYAASIAYFYYIVGKYNAAVNTIERYRSVDNNKMTATLYQVYLEILQKVDDLSVAEQAANRLSKVKNKTFFIYKSLYDYYKEQNDLDKQLSILKKVSSHPKLSKSVYFLLERGNLFLSRGDIDESLKIIYRVNTLEAEKSPVYYAKYLKILGFIFAAEKKFEKAIGALKKSQSVFELDELIYDLNRVKESGDKVIDSLVNEFKIKALNKLARSELKKGNAKEALSIALKALNYNSLNIQTGIILSEIQVKKGYLDDARNQLEKLYKENRGNLELKYAYINILIDTFKYRSALEELESIPQKKDWRYATAKAKFYKNKKDYNSSASWLVKAINYNELHEPNLYELAMLRLKFFRFNKAKSALTKVMDLDPLNVDYKIAYAKVIYEVETAASAIGYLYDALGSFKNNQKILSEIGIYYYKSGQIKNYQDIKEKLISLKSDKQILDRFLLESAKLDDDFDKIVDYSKQILNTNPGDSKTRIYLAEILLESRKFKEAKYQLDEVKKRFSTFPRLNYLYAKLYLLIDEVDKALELGKNEIKENPSLAAGYILVGDIYKRKESLLEARDYYQNAYQLESKNVEALLGLAYVAFHGSQYDLAVDQYNKVLVIDQANSEAYKMLGDLYKKLGRTQQAVQSYRKYLDLSPNSPYKDRIMYYINKIE